jgi:hypothetical protein
LGVLKVYVERLGHLRGEVVSQSVARSSQTRQVMILRYIKIHRSAR